MNKSDLKDGMVVTIRGGQQCILIERNLFKNDFTLNSTLFDYNEDLTHKKNKNNDIVKVFNIGKLKELWKREEVDWDKVPIGAEILFSSDGKKYTEGLFIKKDCDKFIICDDIENRLFSTWKYCKLAEEPKEEVTFYDIEKEMNQYCDDQNEDRICQQECDTCGIKYILANYNLTRKDNK